MGCSSRSRTATSRASAATRTTRSRRASSAPRARPSARSTRIPTVSAAPLVRRDGAHVEVSWDEAFAEIDQRLTALVSEHGTDAVAVYIGNPNAHNYANTLAIRPLVKALRTKNVYSASTVDQMPKHVACGLVFGHPLAIPVPDIDRTDLLRAARREPARVERQPGDRTRLARPARGDQAAWWPGRRRRSAADEDGRARRPARADPPRHGRRAAGGNRLRPLRRGPGRPGCTGRRRSPGSTSSKRRWPASRPSASRRSPASRPTPCARSPASSPRRRRRWSTAGSAPTRPRTGRSRPGSSTCSTS